MISSKWFIGLFILIVGYMLLWLIGKKHVETEISINASKEEVWNALSNTERVKQWNKVLIPIEGSLTENTTVKYYFYQEENGNAAQMEARVIEIIDTELINQRGGIMSIITFDHRIYYFRRGGFNEGENHRKIQWCYGSLLESKSSRKSL